VIGGDVQGVSYIAGDVGVGVGVGVVGYCFRRRRRRLLFSASASAVIGLLVYPTKKQQQKASHTIKV
jgi:hypothetical protein